MDFSTFKRKHIVSQLKSHRKVSFEFLTQKEKRQFLVYYFKENPIEGMEMIGNNEGKYLTEIICDWYIFHKISARYALNTLIDNIIQRYKHNFDEMLDDELLTYQEEQYQVKFPLMFGRTI